VRFLPHVIIAIAAYLLGSVPSGFLAGKARGVDVRALGSGNIGATNVIRFLGKPIGLCVLIVDALKGWLACTLLVELVLQLMPSWAISPGELQASGPFSFRQHLEILGGIFAVLGHNYTCWLGFKGGKGIATSAGVLLAWVPLGLLLSFVTWILTFAFTKYVSVASMVAALVLPFAVWLVRQDPVYVWLTAGLSALAIYKHKSNIQRLLNGTEHRFVSKKTTPAVPR
jgi:glycerol-3-phosphate acyltransferase PlsY